MLKEPLTPSAAYGLTDRQHAHAVAPIDRGKGLEPAHLAANKLRRFPKKYTNIRLAPAVNLKTGEAMEGYQVILYDEP